jgi:TRAP-type C4-dicarboxylate transport system permease small subunit
MFRTIIRILAFISILKILDRILTFFEDWTLFLAVMVALLSLFANVVLRYAFDYSLAWSEELVRNVIIYTTFIGAVVAVKNRSMIKIDAAVQLIPWLKTPLNLFSNLMTLVFSVMMIYYGLKMASLMHQTGQKTIIMEIPMVYMYSIIPLMGIGMIIRTVQVVFEDLTGKKLHDF